MFHGATNSNSTACKHARSNMLMVSLTLAIVVLATLTILSACVGTQTQTRETCAYVLRGFLKHDIVPRSKAGKRQKYSLDIRNLWSTHEKMIDVLKRNFRHVSVWFLTYDSTPPDILEWASRRGNVVIAPIVGSTQFTTLAHGMPTLEPHDAYFIARTDITFFEPLLHLVQRHTPTPQALHVLNFEKNGKSNDVIFYFTHAKRLSFERYVSRPKRSSAHDIHRHIRTRVLTDVRVRKVREQNAFYDLLGHMMSRS